jgi:hypothetical protein
MDDTDQTSAPAAASGRLGENAMLFARVSRAAAGMEKAT